MKAEVGDFAHWRKLWRRVIAKNRKQAPVRLAEIKRLATQAEVCRKLGITDEQILGYVQFTLIGGLRHLAA